MADITPKAFDGMTLSLVAVPLKGNQGEQGKGLRGDPGDSNYQLWLKAGNTGSLEDFLLAMKGEKGEDGQGLTNRGDWEVGLYQPGDYVFSAGTQTAISMWIYRGNEEFISLVPPDEDTDNWIEFAADTGKPLELRNTGEKIQWRIEGDVEWIDLIFVADLRGPAGQKGEKGDKGDAGTGLNNRGTWAAGTYQPGDYVFSAGTVASSSMWILSSTTAYVSNTAPANDLTHWIEFAAPAGPAGEQGNDGLSVNLRKTPTAIQYQQTGGPWTDLVLLSEIKGAKGDQGVKGDQGIKGDKGDTGATGASAYQSALDGGFSGTQAEWVASLKGAKGDPGTTDYNSLSNKPALGTAAMQNTDSFATALQGSKADSALQSVPTRLDGFRGFNTDPHPDELISVCATGLGNPKPAIEVWADDGVTQANISVTSYGANGGGVMHSRMANGTRSAPTAVTAEQIYGGYGGRPFHTGGAFFESSPVSIHWVAKELQQPTSKGGALRILTTPIGGNDRKINTSFAPDGDVIISESTLDQNPHAALRGRGMVVVRKGTTPAVLHAMQYGAGGNPNAGFAALSAQGTPEAPQATALNASGYFSFFGHTGSAYTAAAGLMSFRAASAWTPTSTPCRWGIELTANGATSRREVFAISSEGPMYIANVISAPSGNVGSGGYLFVEGGALKFRGGNGTVTTIAPA